MFNLSSGSLFRLHFIRLQNAPTEKREKKKKSFIKIKKPKKIQSCIYGVLLALSAFGVTLIDGIECMGSTGVHFKFSTVSRSTVSP